MNLNTVTEVKRPLVLEEIQGWRSGNAWLAGGTWLFSEPQIHIDTLIDLETLGWPSLTVSDAGLEIGATCRIAELYAFTPPKEWTEASLIHECCRSFLSSFKIWNEATVGGNIVMSLPAGPMISLAVALEGVYELWPRDGDARRVPAIDFITGQHANVLGAGRAPARDSCAGKRAAQTPRLPPRLAHASRSLLGAADRDVRIERSAADGHRRDDSPGTNPPRGKAART